MAGRKWPGARSSGLPKQHSCLGRGISGVEQTTGVTSCNPIPRPRELFAELLEDLPKILEPLEAWLKTQALENSGALQADHDCHETTCEGGEREAEEGGGEKEKRSNVASSAVGPASCRGTILSSSTLTGY